MSLDREEVRKALENIGERPDGERIERERRMIVYCALCGSQYTDELRLCPECRIHLPEQASWPVDDSWQRTEPLPRLVQEPPQ